MGHKQSALTGQQEAAGKSTVGIMPLSISPAAVREAEGIDQRQQAEGTVHEIRWMILL